MDGRESCYPGFGDWFVRDAWDLHDATRARRVGGDELPWRRRELSAPGNRVTIHYHRYDADYDNVGIWTWDAYYARTPADQELWPVGEDAFGLIFELDRAEYGAPGPGERIG